MTRLAKVRDKNCVSEIEFSIPRALYAILTD